MILEHCNPIVIERCGVGDLNKIRTVVNTNRRITNAAERLVISCVI